MTKISLYRFVTTFCIVPTTDWAAFIQRVVLRIMLVSLVFKLIGLLKQPLFISSLIGLLIWAPETVMWVFMAIGDLELKIMAIMLVKIMPDIFGAGAGAYTTWAQLWGAGLTVLPSQILQVINGLGVAQLLGIITATWTSISSIKIYRKIMMRAGLL